MNAPTCGSVFSGAGLLDIGLHLAGFEHAWLCESDPYRRELLRTRFPGAVVYDDIRTLHGQVAADADERGREAGSQLNGGTQSDSADWHPRRGYADRRGLEVGAECVDLIAGGFPCKGASSAGKQNGFEHAETVLWHEMRRVIGELQPRVVLIENVANILGMAAAPGKPAGSLWGTVLADLAALGFDATWDCVPAAAVGAPHLRDRVFCVATQSARADAERNGGQRGRANRGADVAGGRDRSAADAESGPARCDTANPTRRLAAESQRSDGVAVDWGEYAPAIQRWEAIHGPAPEPLIRRMDDGDPRLSRVRARVDRSRLSALGDGVHVYAGWLVGQYVMDLLAT